MTNRFMMSVAAIALIAGAGFAHAQGTGSSTGGASSGSTAQQSAPSPGGSGNSAAPANRDSTDQTKPSSGMKATQSDDKSAQPGGAKNQRAQDDMKSGAKGEKSAQDNMKGGKDMKAEQKGMGDSKSQTTQTQPGTSSQTTTGQVGAGAKLTTEQRTRISSVIREQRVQPVANVNFEIRPGARIPRSGVSLHPLPRQIVEIYPEWRGYEFILVNNQIVVVNPRTMEIVDVIEA